jgi:hypothetical protein
MQLLIMRHYQNYNITLFILNACSKKIIFFLQKGPKAFIKFIQIPRFILHHLLRSFD